MTDPSHPDAAPSTSGLAGLSPAYFGMVMATGIVSIAAHLLDHPMLAMVLFALNLLAYAVLCLLNLLRALRQRQSFFGDLFDHLRGPGFFTSVAATSIVGSQFLLLTDDTDVAGGLWVLAVVLWVMLTYAIFAGLTIKQTKPPLDKGINGAWLLAVVAT
jgi:tellurite resistance protein TehA-like permease